MEYSIDDLQEQLKNRLKDYPDPLQWQRQNNSDDNKTRFIYVIPIWDDLVNKLKEIDPELHNYAINRWWNFWSSVAVEKIFCELPGVIAHKNTKNRLIDFTINGIPFDHKTTNFPKRFKGEWGESREMALWLYKNQSRGRRFHVGNRLFIVLLDWKLRAEIETLSFFVEEYIFNFSPDSLVRFTDDDWDEFLTPALTNVIWIDKVVDPGFEMTRAAYKVEFNGR